MADLPFKHEIQQACLKTEELVHHNDTQNPWLVKSFDVFLFYCCPECSFKSQLHDDFNNHAMLSHPMARDALLCSEQPSHENLMDNSTTSLEYKYLDDAYEDDDTDEEEDDEEGDQSNQEDCVKKEFDEEDLLFPHSTASPIAQSSNSDITDMFEVTGGKVGTHRFKCKICSHKSRYKQGVIDHVKQVHRKERPYVCPNCPKSFFRKTDLRIHISNVHDGNRRWICETCGHACSSKQSLQKHKLNQHTKSPYHCAYCKFVGPSPKRFYNHYIKEHANNDQALQESLKYHCSVCPKSFDFELLLKLHVEYEHKNTDKMACDKCGKQFSTKSGLKFHVAGVHEGLKPYVCAQCGKNFPTNGSMQTHVKIVHLKTGSVKCEICQQGVANVFYLRKHLREVHPEFASNK